MVDAVDIEPVAVQLRSKRLRCILPYTLCITPHRGVVHEVANESYALGIGGVEAYGDAIVGVDFGRYIGIFLPKVLLCAKCRNSRKEHCDSG